MLWAVDSTLDWRLDRSSARSCLVWCCSCGRTLWSLSAMHWAVDSTLDRRLDLRQRSPPPCVVSQLWLHSLVTLCDALGSRFHFGLALGLAAVLALALFGVAVGATLFGRSRQCFGHSSPPWIGNWTCSSTRSCLVSVAVVAALFGRSLRCFGQSIPLWIGNWACSSACSRLVWCRSCDRTLWSLSAMLWAFESA
jgi:hypothetical protein